MIITREEILNDNIKAGVRTPETQEDKEETGTPERAVEIS